MRGKREGKTQSVQRTSKGGCDLHVRWMNGRGLRMHERFQMQPAQRKKPTAPYSPRSRWRSSMTAPICRCRQLPGTGPCFSPIIPSGHSSPNSSCRHIYCLPAGVRACVCAPQVCGDDPWGCCAPVPCTTAPSRRWPHAHSREEARAPPFVPRSARLAARASALGAVPPQSFSTDRSEWGRVAPEGGEGPPPPLSG